MWWKIFFWFCVISAAFGVIGLTKSNNSLVGILEFADFIIALVGLYAFTYKKKMLSKTFWFYFFWFNVVYDIAYLFYRLAPNDPILQYLSFLVSNPAIKTLSPINAVIVSLLDIPLLYAIYQLARPSKNKK